MTTEIFNYKSPEIPSPVPFPGGLCPFDILKISVSLKGNNKIYINLKASDDDKIDSRIPLHLDITTTRIVAKYGKNKSWEFEQRIDKFASSGTYILSLSSDETQYSIRIDDKLLCTVAHKYPPSSVEILEIKYINDGDDCIKSIAFYKQCIWVGKNFRGQFPENILCCGTDQHNSDMYVGRTYKNNSLLAIRVIPDRNEAFVGYNGKEYPVQDYELLQNSQYYGWKDVENHIIPENAIHVGFDEKAEPLFIGRIEQDGFMLPGNIRKNSCTFVTSYNGKELKFSIKFQVLVTLSPEEMQEKVKPNTSEKICKEEENNTHEKKCIVCFTEDPNCAFTPCGHVAACYGCAEAHLKSDNRCPLCRQNTKSILKIYRSV